MTKRKPSDKELLSALQWLGQTLYALGLASLIDAAPFHFNPHKLPYTRYRCVKCWDECGTRAPCSHRSEKFK